MEVPADGSLTKASLIQLLRDVSITSGIEAKPVVLLVEGDKISTEYMLTIAELMSEGLYHSLLLSHYMMIIYCRSNTVIVHTIRTISDE